MANKNKGKYSDEQKKKLKSENKTITFTTPEGKRTTLGTKDYRINNALDSGWDIVYDNNNAPAENPGATYAREGMDDFINHPLTQGAMMLMPTPPILDVAKGATNAAKASRGLKIGKYTLFPKANPNSHYRNIGGIEGYNNVVKRGIVAPPEKTSGPLLNQIGIRRKAFSEAFYGNKGQFVDPKRYKGEYFVEANNIPIDKIYSNH
jgi:hypothetical protein